MLEEDQQVRFTKLWTDAQPTVSRYVSSLVRDQWAVRDIVQNTSLVLLKKFPEYDESRPFLPWAIGLAKFEVLSHHRDTARNRLICDTEFVELYTQKWAEIAPQLGDEAAALRHCIDELNGRPRTIVSLRYVEGQTSNAIASELDLSAANVRTILKRTRETLRRCIRKQIELQGGTA
ncbi:sigma-70 family RNA polymerase sigma factor [Rhodopirellula sallentina]|uniref:RNA polymerase sigma-70 ECF-like, Rhodopirellula baltica n=1 Tax=Rhodopirellula sallentina SM41 TaxID=1263870 RepID=M5U2L0_9BACT|nr:sigma-70 family RNA polymerase sigma factor [Rhodopirellula sallentina]EMI55680.1 RNA polymerase sigma-70 ECF-like, Rhodopirellula baltica [Rhodopirellula sallentina SM41]